MARKPILLIALAFLVLLVVAAGIHVLWKGSKPTQFLLAKAARHELRMVVGTNGVIEPSDRAEIFAPIDAFVSDLRNQEGAEVTRGQLLMRLESKQIQTTLAEARAALLQAKRQAQLVLAGPAKEELTAVEAAIAENGLQLNQQREELVREEALLKKDATSRVKVENLRKQVNLLELHLESLKQKKQDILNRFTVEEKQWEQNRVNELSRQVALLEQQVQMGSIHAPLSGVLYSLAVKKGSYVVRGQLLAQVYEPGNVLLRANVDEPDLGRIEKGQPVVIEWDGLPDRHWTGAVGRLAQQVVALGNRSVGYVICSVDGRPKDLIPNINVKVQIVTARKADALVVPRAAVFNHDGQPAVLLSKGKSTSLKPVILGLVTPQEIEILQGIQEGDHVVINPGEAAPQ